MDFRYKDRAQFQHPYDDYESHPNFPIEPKHSAQPTSKQQQALNDYIAMKHSQAHQQQERYKYHTNEYSGSSHKMAHSSLKQANTYSDFNYTPTSFQNNQSARHGNQYQSNLKVYQRQSTEDETNDEVHPSDLDEGTIVAKQPYEKVGYYDPREVGFPMSNTKYSYSQRMSRTDPRQRHSQSDKYKLKEESQTRNDAFSFEEIQKQIDEEYQRKLKQVNDEAMQKLQLYQEEHRQKLEQSYIQFQSSVKRSTSKASNSGSNFQPYKNNSSSEKRKRNDSNLSRDSNLSFLEPKSQNRNRFFSPKQMNLVGEEEKDTESQAIKELYQEYRSVIKKNLQPEEEQIYMIDVLEQMHFLDDEAVNDNRMKLCALLRQHRLNFMLYSKSGQYSGESEDIVKNLFKILCAIMNMKLHQRGHNLLDDKLLRTYCEAIQSTHNDPDFTVMDQLHTIKNLVNRKAFTLSQVQIGYIHAKFNNFYSQRKEFKLAEERMQAPVQPSQHVYKPVEREPRQSPHPISSIVPRKMQASLPLKTEAPKPREYESDISDERYSYKPIRSASRNSGAQQPDKVGKRPWSGARPNSRPQSGHGMQYMPRRSSPSPEMQQRKVPLSPSELLNHQKPKTPPRNMLSALSDDLICVLKIELDGSHVEEIRVYRNDDPAEIVRAFGQTHNLSNNAQERLFQQIQEQLEAEYS